MSRTIVLLVAITTAACTDDPRTDRHDENVSATVGAPGGLSRACPYGSECPDFVSCSELGETACRNRSDCEAIYDTSGTFDKFVECRDRTAPVCAGEGKSCTASSCCPGLHCCGGSPIATGDETCTADACPVSDRNQKHAIVPVDTEAVLQKLGKLPVATWTYNFENGVRHMGPMAQDFAAAFDVGATNRRIFTVDADGVALASIQALLHRMEKLQGVNAALERDNVELRNRLLGLERRTVRLEHGTH